MALLSSFSPSPLLVHKNCIVYCILILFPATLLNFFISVFLCFIYVKLCHPQTGIICFSFSIGISFIPFSYLISLAKASIIMLNKNSATLVPDPRKKVFNFSPFRIMFFHISSLLCNILSVPNLSFYQILFLNPLR